MYIYIVVASYFLALQSPEGSSVAMFKSIPSHRWLPNSTTDPQRWLKVCSNDAFPFWTSKMWQKAVSDERDLVKKIHHGFGRKQYGYSCGSLALQSPGGSLVAMFKTKGYASFEHTFNQRWGSVVLLGSHLWLGILLNMATELPPGDCKAKK